MTVALMFAMYPLLMYRYCANIRRTIIWGNFWLHSAAFFLLRPIKICIVILFRSWTNSEEKRAAELYNTRSPNVFAISFIVIVLQWCTTYGSALLVLSFFFISVPTFRKRFVLPVGAFCSSFHSSSLLFSIIWSVLSASSSTLLLDLKC